MAMHATSVIGNRGFTLLELLVVLTILVLITCAWPLASSHMFVTQRLRNEMQQLASSIRVAQVTARTTGMAQSLQLAADGTAYQIEGAAHELPEGLVIRRRDDLSHASNAPLTFFQDGSSSGGILDISAQDHILSLRVFPMTGALEMPQ